MANAAHMSYHALNLSVTLTSPHHLRVPPALAHMLSPLAHVLFRLDHAFITFRRTVRDALERDRAGVTGTTDRPKPDKRKAVNTGQLEESTSDASKKSNKKTRLSVASEPSFSA
jgi:hypothetical protein